MGDSSQAMGARQAESRTRPLVGKSKSHRTHTIQRVHDASIGLYGMRMVWHQLRREGIMVVDGGVKCPGTDI